MSFLDQIRTRGHDRSVLLSRMTCACAVLAIVAVGCEARMPADALASGSSSGGDEPPQPGTGSSEGAGDSDEPPQPGTGSSEGAGDSGSTGPASIMHPSCEAAAVEPPIEDWGCPLPGVAFEYAQDDPRLDDPDFDWSNASIRAANPCDNCHRESAEDLRAYQLWDLDCAPTWTDSVTDRVLCKLGALYPYQPEDTMFPMLVTSDVERFQTMVIRELDRRASF